MITRRFLMTAAMAAIRGLAQELKLPNKPDSFHFAVIGDTGTGGRRQYETAAQMDLFYGHFPFKTVIMLGDNMYGGQTPKHFVSKFERPYGKLLNDGVKFYAALGNHDNPNQKNYKNFHMNGQRYYTFRPHAGIRFFVVDSNYMDKPQAEWLEKELSNSGSDWKIAYFHHPLYSSGARHGPDEDLRKVLEPLFVKYGVSAVFAGHEHFYERLKPQRGIHYFIEGGSAKLREGNIKRSPESALGFDTDTSFMLCEIEGDQLHFQTISRTGKTVDSGAITRTPTADQTRVSSAP